MQTTLAPERTERYLDGDRAAYLVEAGAADLFAVRRDDERAPDRRHPIARVPAGAVLHTCPANGSWRLLLVPLPGTNLREIAAGQLHQLIESSGGDQPTPAALAYTVGVDRALQAVATALAESAPPRGATIIQPGTELTLTADSAIAANGVVSWLTPVSGELATPDDGSDEADSQTPRVLAGRDWVEARSDCVLRSQTTLDLLRAGELSEALERHTDRVLTAAAHRVALSERAHLSRLGDRKRINAAMVYGAARQSLRVLKIGNRRVQLGEAPADVSGTAASAARLARADAVLRVVVDDTDLVRQPLDQSPILGDEREAVLAVTRSSALNTRELTLPDGWWRRDFGPLVAWRPIGGPPEVTDPTDEPPMTAVALVYRRGRYYEIDPETLARTKITRETAADLATQALTVQQPMPPTGSLRSLFRIAVRPARRDAGRVVLAGLAVAALGLATPLVTGEILGQLVSGQGNSRLFNAAAIFVVAAVVAAMIGVIHNLLFLRLEGRVERDTQITVWDRILRLPLRFFGRSSSGEITSVVMGVMIVREALGGLLAQAQSAALMILMALLLLVSIDVAVAGLAAAIVALVAIITAVLGTVVIRRQRRALPDEHRATAFTNQLIDGIIKVKLAAAEDRAYARWAGVNAIAEGGARRVRAVQSVLLTLSAVLPIGAQLFLLAMLAGPMAGSITPQQFFVVNAAFLTIVGMMLLLVNAGVEALALVPRLGELSLVTDSETELRAERADPGELRGEIELADVSFAYSDDGPLVLDRISLNIQPGQFVAIVGPSGCGKSTLLRMLLGFELPKSGTVLYDRQDLSELDVTAVRRQCGVVLQNGLLFAGSIRENIAGASDYPLDRIWDAARMAGIDDDIADLPMGVNTVLPFGGGTLSVGQRQRLLIARALVARPRILFFDEATSALDNRTQEIVTTSTRALAATRVVIAHRLSTIADADMIVVLDQGRIVQQGRYADLMTDTDGLFAELARRQLLDEE